jgi:hypothetical protein
LGFQTLEADSAKLGLQRKLYILGVKESLKPPAIEENRQAFDCQLSAQREEFFHFLSSWPRFAGNYKISRNERKSVKETSFFIAFSLPIHSQI